VNVTWEQNIQETFRNLETLYISFSHQKHAKDRRKLWISKLSDGLGVSGIETGKHTESEKGDSTVCWALW